MSGYHIVFLQAGSAQANRPAQAATADQAAPAPPVPPTREQIRNQIRQSIEQATRAAAQASVEASRAGRVITIDGSPVIAGDLPSQGVTIHRTGMEDVIPPQAVDISIAFFVMIAVIIIGWPLARAFGRRLERRGDLPAAPDATMAGQLQRIEQAVEAMSIEIERISESQRFMAKLQNGAAADRAALGGGERR